MLIKKIGSIRGIYYEEKGMLLCVAVVLLWVYGEYSIGRNLGMPKLLRTMRAISAPTAARNGRMIPPEVRFPICG